MAGNLYEQGYYETGTASITQGQTVVTGQGTAWSQIVRPADDFGKHVGMPIPIASVDSDTQITLAYPWPGPTQAAAPYRVTFTPYHVAYRQALQEIGQLLSSGNVSALAGLAGGANKLPFFDGTGTMDQTVLSAFMRTLLDDADGPTAYGTLGTVPNAQISNSLTPDKAFRRGNVLGTVAQSGGVPTGSLIEYGGSANGYYVRFADGTQICWHPAVASLDTNAPSGSVWVSSAYETWVYPAAFSLTPAVSAGQRGAASVRWVTVRTSTETACTVNAFGAYQSSVNLLYSALAIGRWF